MPLIHGKSKKAFEDNIKELEFANKSKSKGEKRPLKQILAIAYSKKRTS